MHTVLWTFLFTPIAAVLASDRHGVLDPPWKQDCQLARCTIGRLVGVMQLQASPRSGVPKICTSQQRSGQVRPAQFSAQSNVMLRQCLHKKVLQCGS